MNIDIANRLYEYRKQHNLSQEELAQRIGVSRQAVSKWERAESSPDTDNLIELARLYGVSLDDLLFTDEPITRKDQEPAPEPAEEEPGDYVHIGLDGIHVKDGKDEVHIGLGGIHVTSDDDEVHVSFKDGVQVLSNGEFEFDSRSWKESVRRRWYLGPIVPLLTVAAYLFIGFEWGLWHPGWLIFFVIPNFYQFCAMARAQSLRSIANCFPIATLCLPTYLIMGFFFGMWHPGWIIFLAIPAYYMLVNSMFKD